MQAICKGEKKHVNYSMLSTQKNSPQSNLFHDLADQLDQKHPLYSLANKINWSVLYTKMTFNLDLIFGG